MNIESLKIKSKTNYDWDNVVYIYDIDVKLIKVIKRESRIGKTYNIKPFYLVINHLFDHIEKIEGSSDRYLVVNINNINKKKIINVFDEIWK